MKLSSKILFANSLGIVIILLASMLFTFSFTKSIVEQSIMDQQLEIARQTLDKVDRLLNERVLDIQDIAGADAFENLILAAGETGMLRKDALRRLNEYAVLTGPWDLLMAADPSGRIILASDETQFGKRVEDQPQNKKALDAAMLEDFYYSDFVLSENTGRPTVIFAAPIRNLKIPNRPIIGTVIGHFSWPAVLQILEDVSARALLLNREGVVIGQNSSHTGIPRSKEAGSMEGLGEVFKERRPKSFIIRQGEGLLSADALVSCAPQLGYLSFGGSGWKLLLEKPAAIAFAPATLTAFKLACMLIPIILAGAFPILFLIVRWVSRPISILTQTTRLIAEGDLTRKVPIATRDEMGELAASFNVMTEKLKKSYEGLETQVKERTEALEKSEQKFRLVMETAKDAFIAIDDQGRVTDWNPQAETVFGWSREEVVGKILAEYILPPQYREAHRKGIETYLKTGKGPVLNKSIEIKALHKQGHEFPVDMTIWPLRLGNEMHFNAFIRDISDRKRLEGAVMQSEKMSAIGQLAAGVAHEINNPLGVILGFAQNVAKRIQPGDAFELPLRSIEREAVRCKNLVQDLLTFSRAGKAEKESLDLKEALVSALSLIQAQTNVKNITLVKELSDVPVIQANGTQIQQIIVNLCNNAVDAMPQGGTLTVRLQKAKKNREEGVEIQVEDTGTGIKEEIRDKIFDPFFTTKEIGKGTGLGLSLVYEIVQKHSGEITVDCEPGKRTLFKIFLPLVP